MGVWFQFRLPVSCAHLRTSSIGYQIDLNCTVLVEKPECAQIVRNFYLPRFQEVYVIIYWRARLVTLFYEGAFPLVKTPYPTAVLCTTSQRCSTCIRLCAPRTCTRRPAPAGPLNFPPIDNRPPATPFPGTLPVDWVAWQGISFCTSDNILDCLAGPIFHALI